MKLVVDFQSERIKDHEDRDQKLHAYTHALEKGHKTITRPSHEWRAIARARAHTRAHTRHKFDKACDHRTPWF